MQSEDVLHMGKWSPAADGLEWRPTGAVAAVSVPAPGFGRSIRDQLAVRRGTQRSSGFNRRDLYKAFPPTARMFGRMSLVMLAADISGLLMSCGVAALIVSVIFKMPLSDLSAAALSLFTPILLGNLLAGLYPGIALNPVVEFRQLSRTAAVSFFGITALVCLGRLGFPWITFFMIAGPLQFMIAPMSRAWIRAVSCRRKWWGYPVMIFGSGEAAKTIILNLRQHPGYGLRPAIVVDPAAAITSFMGLEVISRPRLTSALAKRLKIRHAIVVLPDLPRDIVTRVLERHAKGIRHVVLTSAISPFSPGLPILWRDTRDLAGVAGVEVRNRLLDPTPGLIKRCMDVILTVGGGLCILPALCVIAMLVKLSSKGPIFYSHTRIGHRGQRFAAWKFRSMVVNGKDILRDHLANNPDARAEWDLDHKLKNDPRVTRLGALLRKASLDELPQLWNVLKGEMSLVGPRPIVDEEIAKYGKCYNIYKAVRPGITGLWQVSGRNDTTYDERLRHDEFYVRNWSPWLDMHILARTVAALAGGDGAY